jgi:hypothetical protein
MAIAETINNMNACALQITVQKVVVATAANITKCAPQSTRRGEVVRKNNKIICTSKC